MEMRAGIAGLEMEDNRWRGEDKDLEMEDNTGGGGDGG